MRAPTIVIAGLWAALLAAPVSAPSGQPELADLFPWEAELRLDRSGLARLDLPAEVVSRSRADLSDLRVFDASGTEVPYLIDSGPGVENELERRETMRAEVLQVDRATEGRADAPDRTRQSLEIAAPPDGAGGWELVVELRGAPGEFVRRVEVRGIDASGAEHALAEGSIFRLGPAGERRHRLPLTAFEGPRVRVVLRGEDGEFLTPAFRYERTRTVETQRELVVPLEIEETRRKSGVTMVSASRPAGVLPALLRLESSTSAYDRPVAVWDEGRGRPDRLLGTGRILALRGAGPAEPVQQRDIRLAPAQGERLRLEIQDGDSPPLEGLEVSAVVRQPSLVFSLPTEGGTLRFGGGRTHRPRYDLSSLLPPVRGEEGDPSVEATGLLYEQGALVAAEMGAIRRSPSFDASPALAFAMRPAAAADSKVYEYRQSLRIPDTPEGLARLVLPPETVAVLRADLADLRVVDAQDRQWPFLLDRDAGVETTAAEAHPVRGKPGETRYRLDLPAAPIPVTGIVLDTETPFFDRPFELRGTPPGGEERVLARGRLTRRVRDFVPVEIALPAARVEDLSLVVRDGDEAPLTWSSVQIRTVQPELFVTAPEGDYALLLGEPEAGAPSYDIQRVRGMILSVRPAEANLGELRANPRFSLAARAGRGGRPARILLWTSLVLAVLVLGGLTLWMARGEGEGGDQEPG